MIRELLLAVRRLAREPGFALALVVTLALGIGSTTAIFSLVDAVLLRPLPYPKPDQLVRIWGRFTAPAIPRALAAEAEVVDYQKNFSALEAVGAYLQVDGNLTGGDEPEAVRVFYASNEVFRALGVPPQLGRVYTAEDERPGAPPVVVLSDGLWRRRFGGDRSLVGKTIDVNLAPRTVLGVMPRGFDFPGGADLWSPLGIDPANMSPRQEHLLEVVARLAPWATLDQAKEQVRAQTSRWPEHYPMVYAKDSGWDVDLVPLLEQEVGDVRPTLYALLAAVAFMLLITSANVGGMLLVRVEAREREIVIRSALGGGRAALVRRFAAESLVGSIAGGALGLAGAMVALRLFVQRFPDVVARAAGVRLDGAVAAFAVAVTLVTALLVSLLPALVASRPNLSQALKGVGSAAGAGAERSRSRTLLVAAEIALAIVLLALAGLTLTAYRSLQREEVGFKADGVLTLKLGLPRSRYADPAKIAGFFGDLEARLASLPGIASAGTVSRLPLGGGPSPSATAVAEGRSAIAGTAQPEPATRSVTPGYFAAMGIRVVSGRAFTPGDVAGSPTVAIVDEPLAATFWPGRDPLGRRVRLGPPDAPEGMFPWATVVGVVAAVREEGPQAPPRGDGTLYFPMAQRPERTAFVAVEVKRGEPTALAAAVRRAVREIDPDQPVADVRPMSARLARALARPRIAALLLSLFAGLSLLLSALGLHALIAELAARRTREIGVRMALGARRATVVRWMLGQAARPVAAGALAGVALAWGLSRFASSLVFGLGDADAITLATVVLLLGVVAMIAALVPAWRASRLPPNVALREE